MSKLNLYLIGGILVLIGVVYILWNIGENRQKEIDILNVNQSALLSDIKVYKDKNGELVSMVDGFTVDKSTFKTLNDSLYREVSNLKLKLKNVTSVVQIKEVIRYVNGDTIYSVEKDSTERQFFINEPYFRMELSIINDSIIAPNDLSIALPNEQMIVLESPRYKGWWFWKKLVGAKLHVKNSNPYYEITEAEYFDFTKIKE